MNRDCHGDVFERHGKFWGMCFLDSTIFELKSLAKGQMCPNCARVWYPVLKDEHFDPDNNPRVALQLDLPHYKRVAEELRELEEAAKAWYLQRPAIQETEVVRLKPAFKRLLAAIEARLKARWP